MSTHNEILKSLGASTFLEAKLKEFEAACYFGYTSRILAIEEDCRIALQGVLDAKRKLIEKQIDEAKRAR